MDVWDVRQDDEVSEEEVAYCDLCGDVLVEDDDLAEGRHDVCPFEDEMMWPDEGGESG